MIKTEATYRALQMDSSSSLKEFLMNRKKYHKKYILNEAVEEEDSKASVTGRVVETLLLEPEEFDNRFFMSSCISAPTGLMLAFVEGLYKVTSEATDEFGNINRSFEDIAKDAFALSGFSGKGTGSFDAVIKKFSGSDAEIYYNELRTVKAKGLTVVTTQDVTNSENIVTELKSNFVTSEIVNLVNSSRYTIHNQFQVEGYSVDNHLFKSMIDKVVIDHHERTIQAYDLKCTWNVENFYEEYYLYRRAYIQAYLYFKACESLTFQGELQGYTVLPIQFIVCDSTNYFNPLVYTLGGEDLHDAYVGFEYKGRKYTGVKEIISGLNWAVENDTWNISKENYDNNGILNLTKCKQKGQ